MATEGFAPAKVNLSLHVTGQRADGYHLLDSLVVFADVGDRLWFEPADAMSLEVNGPFSDGVPADARNLVWKGAVAAGWTGHIRLEKNLPNGAGIGGGSSDAAAFIRYLARPDLAASLGADVPVCLGATAQRMRGIGDELTMLDGFPVLNALLVNPGIGVPTPDVFRGLADKENAAMPEPVPSFRTPQEIFAWLAAMRNDLEVPAVAIRPIIGDVLDALAGLRHAKLHRMSGSGATCFALFENGDAAKEAALDLQRAHPDWWVKPCRLS